jgi:hypothetical protein
LSCTIFYKGKLKENTDIQSVIEIIKSHTKSIDCSLIKKKNIITLLFNQGKTEPLVFDFNNDKIDSFCKWNGIDEQEFYKIFDIFIAIKPYFKSLKIEDDGGFWYTYNNMHKPCKIVRRTTFNNNEIKLLERIKANSKIELSQIEKDIYKQMYHNIEGSEPYSYRIWLLIVKDVVRLFAITEFDENTQACLLKKANKLMPSYFSNFNIVHFTGVLMSIIVTLWVGEFMLYKDLGSVSLLDNNIRGLDGSKEAAIWGIMSSFLNSHSGIVNLKHSEIDKFMVQQLSCEFYFILNELQDEGKTELELLVSILDYLGFKYYCPYT